jgi:pantoate--beta-alanine ligase
MASSLSVKLVDTIAEIRANVAEARRGGKTIGVVPTMGALHEGHAALMRRARGETGYVVVTIFVNPIQFNRPEDLSSYPRTMEQDLARCEAHGVDTVFAPTAQEMYPEKLLTSVEVDQLASGLCGEFRPGHFRGVATVVAKLFNIVPADFAYFGEKDYQQLAIIRKMASDLNFPVQIVPVPTVREADGLALSSRNQRLTPEHRKLAPQLHRALLEAAGSILNIPDSTANAKQRAMDLLAATPELRVEYLEIVDAETLEPVEHVTGPVRIAAAAWLGDVRLIDNVPA